MPDSRGRLTPEEVHVWPARPCPVCGGLTRQEWIDRTTANDAAGEEWWQPGERVCITRERHHVEALLELHEM